MDFKVNREIFSTREVIYDGSNEQSVELDYILPDYYPDIFRVLKCQLSPKVVSYNVSGEKLVCELVAYIKILYVSENSNALNCIEQKMTYTKTIDMGKAVELPDVTTETKSDYINCRVVNAKRLDLRGAITIKSKVIGQKKQEVVIDAYGSNIQLKKDMVSYPTKYLSASKTVTLLEDMDMGASKPDVDCVIRSEATITDEEYKIVPSKMIVKGQANVSMLYSCSNDGENSLECMQFEVPFSQIVDVDGLTEDYDSNIDITVISCEITPKPDSENKSITCEIVLSIKCSSVRYDNMEIITDAYSTKYPCKYEKSDTKIDKKPLSVCEMHSGKVTLQYSEGDIMCVYDCWAKVTQITCRYDSEKEKYLFSGNCNCVVMAKNETGRPVYLETDTPFEHYIDIDAADGGYIIPKATITACSYNLTSTNSVEVKAEIRLCGLVYESSTATMISSIEVDTSEEKQHNSTYALKLYYAQQNEQVWDIAKNYSTSVDAIMDENDLTDGTISIHEMLLIPMTE